MKLFHKIFNYFRKPRIFFISDLHLDHENIIKYTNRPFKNKYIMNKVLVRNWNKTIRRNDIVYFLGDLSRRGTDYWLKRLKGKIIFIKGNHGINPKNSKDYEVLNYKNYKFLLIHNPYDLPIEWDGWVIHGHKHNNDLINYPLINHKTKTINVSVELINYKPIEIKKIIRLIENE